MWLRPSDDTGPRADVYGNLGAPYPSVSGLPKERLTGQHEPSLAVRLQQPEGEPENMSTSFLNWFLDLRAEALRLGIHIEPLTHAEVMEFC
jgi:hypothetical protein